MKTIIFLLLIFPTIVIAQTKGKEISGYPNFSYNEKKEGSIEKYNRLFVNIDATEKIAIKTNSVITPSGKGNFIGTNKDPFAIIRNTPIGVPQSKSYRIDVRQGSEYSRSSSTQYFDIDIRK